MHLHLSDAVVGVFVLALFYTRVRRAVVFQKLDPLRVWTRSVMFALVCTLLLAADAHHAVAIAADLGGAAAGAALGLVAMRGTVLRRQDGGCAYRPHPWIGFALLALFLGSLVDRLVALYAAGGASLSLLIPRVQPAAYARDVWTVAAYFLLAAYSVLHSLLVLAASRRLEPGPPAVEAGSGRPSPDPT